MAGEYPVGLPLPQVDSYSLQLSMGFTSTVFEGGNTRQRRRAMRERYIFSLSFVLTTAQLWTWQSWANMYGYQWHTMLLASDYSDQAGLGLTVVPHTIRYISNISFETLSVGIIRAYVGAEMNIGNIPSYVIVPSGNWYFAGTPPLPSADIISSGTLNAPSINVVISGSPSIPAA
jgi:hypothetical protein